MPLAQIPPSAVTPEEGLQRLKDGNERFLRGEAVFSTAPSKETLADLAKGQHPFATILGCSDSRVPPELIFDVGFGDLFVVRVAGNVVSTEVMGSLQFANFHLKTSLIIVLGHEGCGAVNAAMSSKQQGVQQFAQIQNLVDDILPGLPDFDPQLSREECLAQAVHANVRWTMRQIEEKASHFGKERLATGSMKLLGAVYEIATGRVRFLDE